MRRKERTDGRYYLVCERNWIYFLLIGVAGIFGAYTYLERGGVFCNAQTVNVVLMGMALGTGNWGRAPYYIVPVTAYVAGAFVSELVPGPVKRRLSVRWDTLLILVELLAVAALGLVPDAAPVQISQVAVNFIASMQYNTFRQAEGTPVATTFATNHIRQIGVGLAREVHHRRSPDKSHRERLRKHFVMLLCFAAGVVAGTVACGWLGGRAIWLALPPLALLFGVLLHADLTTEKDLVGQKPAGH